MDRREFLKITGMGGAALATGGISIGLPKQSQAAKKEEKHRSTKMSASKYSDKLGGKVRAELEHDHILLVI